MTLSTDNLFYSKRLKMTPPRAEDVQTMLQWNEDPEYLRNVDTDIAIPYSEKQLEDEGETKDKEVYFRLRTLEDEQLIGFVVIHSIEWNNRCGQLAIGIGLAEHRNKGYGTEALNLILRYAFHELNLDRVGLDVIAYNAKGIRAYEKVGFQLEGRARSAVYRDGKRYDRLLMGILRPEWEVHNQINVEGGQA
ncbi:GNAT family N-acetyltransferase [Paenibacillus taichungensis]|uniref:GNAT family N-acetyltransferase n=1 Tax=Paenibacillus taichungensis TaxID=484184 RepID=UPI0038D202B7